MNYYQSSYQNPSTDPPPPYNLHPPSEPGWKPSAPPTVPHGYYEGPSDGQTSFGGIHGQPGFGQTNYGVIQGQSGFGQTSYGVVQGQSGFGQTSYGVVQGQPGCGPPGGQMGYPYYTQQPPLTSPAGWGPQYQPTHTVILTEEKPSEKDRMAECFLLGCCSSILCCCLLDP
ncbi:uncharacterized protein LOC143229557 [Tachypleus tridentatus]|uniref:uncharacterized protein LOC143229557 n=1 Tax=Tachypleus tridentatus TaxID=6853 RepID=UPI003FD0F118